VATQHDQFFRASRIRPGLGRQPRPTLDERLLLRQLGQSGLKTEAGSLRTAVVYGLTDQQHWNDAQHWRPLSLQRWRSSSDALREPFATTAARRASPNETTQRRAATRSWRATGDSGQESARNLADLRQLFDPSSLISDTLHPVCRSRIFEQCICTNCLSSHQRPSRCDLSQQRHHDPERSNEQKDVLATHEQNIRRGQLLIDNEGGACRNRSSSKLGSRRAESHRRSDYCEGFACRFRPYFQRESEHSFHWRELADQDQTDETFEGIRTQP